MSYGNALVHGEKVVPESWDPEDDDWDVSSEFQDVIKQFRQLQEVTEIHQAHFADFALTMKDFQFALIQLFKKYPQLLKDSPEGQKLMEASQKVSNLDFSKWFK